MIHSSVARVSVRVEQRGRTRPPHTSTGKCVSMRDEMHTLMRTRQSRQHDGEICLVRSEMLLKATQPRRQAVDAQAGGARQQSDGVLCQRSTQ